MRAFIFPGQGSQKVGMGADLADASAAARETFQEVDEALNQKLSAMMRDGPDAELTLTSNAQPAIMANAIATLRALEKDFGVKSGTSYWPPCHLQPAYRERYGFKEGDYPRAEAVLNQTIALPMHCHLTDEEVRRVIAAVQAVAG